MDKPPVNEDGNLNVVKEKTKWNAYSIAVESAVFKRHKIIDRTVSFTPRSGGEGIRMGGIILAFHGCGLA